MSSGTPAKCYLGNYKELRVAESFFLLRLLSLFRLRRALSFLPLSRLHRSGLLRGCSCCRKCCMALQAQADPRTYKKCDVLSLSGEGWGFGGSSRFWALLPALPTSHYLKPRACAPRCLTFTSGRW